MRRAVIYGLGERYRVFEEWFYDEMRNDYQIVAVSDKKQPEKGFQNTFIKPDNIVTIDFDIIIITSDKFFEEILSELQNNYGIATDKITSLDEIIESIYKKKFMVHLFADKRGVEIGGPSSMFENNIYAVCGRCDGVNYSPNTVWWKKEGEQYAYHNKKLGEIVISDAVDLSLIRDAEYEFCISSNNLEHIANPIKALKEQKRILKMGGILLVIVPMKDKCFDHNRDYTDISHLIDDYVKDISEEDLTHLDEIMDKHDFSMDVRCGGRDKFAKRALKNYENRCLHHHVFHTETLIGMFQYLDIQVLSVGKIGSNYYIIGEK